MGVDPRPLTLRELLWLGEGHGREAWGRTSALLAMLVNCHRDPKKGRPARPEDFDPYAQGEGSEVVHVDRENISAMKQDFVGGGVILTKT